MSSRREITLPAEGSGFVQALPGITGLCSRKGGGGSRARSGRGGAWIARGKRAPSTADAGISQNGGGGGVNGRTSGHAPGRRDGRGCGVLRATGAAGRENNRRGIRGKWRGQDRGRAGKHVLEQLHGPLRSHGRVLFPLLRLRFLHGGQLAAEMTWLLPAEGVLRGLRDAGFPRIVRQHGAPGISLDQGMRTTRKLQAGQQKEQGMEELLQTEWGFEKRKDG